MERRLHLLLIASNFLNVVFSTTSKNFTIKDTKEQEVDVFGDLPDLYDDIKMIDENPEFLGESMSSPLSRTSCSNSPESVTIIIPDSEAPSSPSEPSDILSFLEAPLQNLKPTTNHNHTFDDEKKLKPKSSESLPCIEPSLKECTALACTICHNIVDNFEGQFDTRFGSSLIRNIKLSSVIIDNFVKRLRETDYWLGEDASYEACQTFLKDPKAIMAKDPLAWVVCRASSLRIDQLGILISVLGLFLQLKMDNINIQSKTIIMRILGILLHCTIKYSQFRTTIIELPLMNLTIELFNSKANDYLKDSGMFMIVRDKTPIEFFMPERQKVFATNNPLAALAFIVPSSPKLIKERLSMLHKLELDHILHAVMSGFACLLTIHNGELQYASNDVIECWLLEVISRINPAIVSLVPEYC